MSRSTRSRVPIGSILEVATISGYGYLQTTHRDGWAGDVLRVLPGLFADPLSDEAIDRLAMEEESYFILTVASMVAHEDGVRVVGHRPIPERAQGMPPFRFAWRFNDPHRSVYVDGQQVFVERFTPEQETWSLLQHLPIDEIKQRIERQWQLADYRPARPLPTEWTVEIHSLHVGQEGVKQMSEALDAFGGAVLVEPSQGRAGYDVRVTISDVHQADLLSRIQTLRGVAKSFGGIHEGIEFGASGFDDSRPVAPTPPDWTFELHWIHVGHAGLKPLVEDLAPRVEALHSEQSEGRSGYDVRVTYRNVDPEQLPMRIQTLRDIAQRFGGSHEGIEFGNVEPG